MKNSETYDFTIDFEGKVYKCSRTVYGERIMNQIITVSGYSSKTDSARYGRGKHPISDMENIAELIALEILKGRL